MYILYALVCVAALGDEPTKGPCLAEIPEYRFATLDQCERTWQMMAGMLRIRLMRPYYGTVWTREYPEYGCRQEAAPAAPSQTPKQAVGQR